MSAPSNLTASLNIEQEKQQALSVEKEAKRLRLRSKSIKELIDTEIQYVNDLLILTAVYIEPLQPSNTNIINAEQHRLLFNNIPALIKLNTQFKLGLEERYKDWNPSCSKIADQFLQFAPYFHMYQGYLNSHEQAAGLVSKLEIRSSKFKKFIDNAQFNPQCKGLDLKSFLVKPLQRITKYSLLLRELNKHTLSDHPDYPDLQLAMEKIKEVNLTINEKMKTFDQRQKVRDVQARFTQNVDIVAPARYFIKEGKLTKICRKKDAAYIFVLFSDLLIYGEQASEGSGGAQKKDYQIKIHQQIPINQSFTIRDIPQNAKYGAKCWEIHSPQKSFIVYADHPGLKQVWLKDMVRVVALRSTIFSGKQRPAALWVPDDFTSVCMMNDCESKFTVINRRHHCRYCGRLVCGECSKNKLPHWNKRNKTVRVCSLCYSENKELQHYKNTRKGRADTQLGIIDDEDSLSVESDVDFEYWDSDVTVENENENNDKDDINDAYKDMNLDAVDVPNDMKGMSGMMRSKSDMSPETRLNGNGNVNGAYSPKVINTKSFERKSTKKKRGRMLNKAQIRKIHQRSASLGDRNEGNNKTTTNRGIFSHQAKIFKLSYSHTPKKSTHTLYELADMSSDIKASQTFHAHTYTNTNSFNPESFHVNTASFQSMIPVFDEEKQLKRHTSPPHSNRASLIRLPSSPHIHQGNSLPTHNINMSPRTSGSPSHRRLKLVGTGTLNIEAHQYDHELVSMRLHTFTEVIDWNLDPHSMKPKKRDDFSCYLKALNVLSQQNEILLIRIKDKDIMASLVTILLSLSYYYEAENANRDDDDMDSNVEDSVEENNTNGDVTVALSKDTSLEEHKAEIDRAVFLIENSKKHNNIKTIDVAKFLIAKSCPITVIRYAFLEAGVVMPEEVYHLVGLKPPKDSKQKRFRDKERNIYKNAKRNTLLSTEFRKERTRSNEFSISGSGNRKRFNKKKLKRIELKQSLSAEVGINGGNDYWLPPDTSLPDADNDGRYQEALHQHDVRFSLMNTRNDAETTSTIMPSDKLDGNLRIVINRMSRCSRGAPSPSVSRSGSRTPSYETKAIVLPTLTPTSSNRTPKTKKKKKSKFSAIFSKKRRRSSK